MSVTKLKTSNEDIGRRIAVVLKDMDMSPEEIGKLAGLVKQTVYNNIKGTTPINPDLQLVICYKFGYSPDWLLSGVGEKKGGKSVKLITDVQQFRVELDIRDAQIKVMKSHIELLFKKVEDLENKQL
jgi:transcriptional regulator with XRE-family HTH domain